MSEGLEKLDGLVKLSVQGNDLAELDLAHFRWYVPSSSLHPTQSYPMPSHLAASHPICRVRVQTRGSPHTVSVESGDWMLTSSLSLCRCIFGHTRLTMIVHDHALTGRASRCSTSAKTG